MATTTIQPFALPVPDVFQKTANQLFTQIVAKLTNNNTATCMSEDSKGNIYFTGNPEILAQAMELYNEHMTALTKQFAIHALDLILKKQLYAQG